MNRRKKRKRYNSKNNLSLMMFMRDQLVWCLMVTGLRISSLLGSHLIKL
jgi:hypothetical protein